MLHLLQGAPYPSASTKMFGGKGQLLWAQHSSTSAARGCTSTGGEESPALPCSALLPGCSVCRAPSPSFLHTPSPSRAAQGRTLRCRFRSDTPSLRGKAIALREHCSLQHQQLSRLALLLGQFWKPSPSRVHFISEQINSRLFASNRVSASKPHSCS